MWTFCVEETAISLKYSNLGKIGYKVTVTLAYSDAVASFRANQRKMITKPKKEAAAAATGFASVGFISFSSLQIFVIPKIILWIQNFTCLNKELK